MRSINSIKNTIAALSGHLLNIIVMFASRTLFIKILGIEFLGINGLFTNILTILSLAELGIGTSITYSLFKPIADKDTEKIKSLMRFYQISYRIIGATVLILGGVLTPYIGFFITETPRVSNLKLIFFLFVLNTATSYFYSYKKNMIIADQKQYIVSIYQNIFLVLQNIIQIAMLYITRNYIIFLLVQTILTFLQNVMTSLKADKMYPFLKENDIAAIDRKTIQTIKKNVGAMFLHKTGSMVVSATDNILISKLIGITAVGLYSNYSIIINAINGLLVQIFSSITASIGNIGAIESKEYTQTIFQRVLFMNFWIYAFCSICLLTLINPFVSLWIGNEMILDISIIVVIIINFYLSGMRRTVLTFRDSLGLYWYDRHKPIAEALINLVGSIILAKTYGLIGIFLGTTISTIATSLWIEPLILYKYGFNRKWSEISEYFSFFIKNTIIFCIASIINYQICELIVGNTIISFVKKVLVSLIFPNTLFLIIFWRNKNFKWFQALFNDFKRKSVQRLLGR